MKTLYESILGSTKSGAVSVIDEWWKSFKNNDLYGDYSIQKIDNKFYIIFDDFTRTPHQTTIRFERDDLDKLPKHLGGICWTDYNNKIQGKVRPCNIYITNMFNKKIDLSNWDLSHWEIPVADVMVRIMFCRGNTEIVGIPKYKKDFYVHVSNCDINKFEVDNTLASIEISDCDFEINSIKNTSVKRLYVDYKAFVDYELFEKHKTLDGILYRKTPRRFEFIPEQSNKIEKLKKDNDIKEIRYTGKKEDTSPLYVFATYPIENYNGLYSIPKRPK